MRKAHSSNPEQLSYKTVQGFILYNRTLFSRNEIIDDISELEVPGC